MIGPRAQGWALRSTVICLALAAVAVMIVGTIAALQSLVFVIVAVGVAVVGVLIFLSGGSPL